MSWTRLVSTTLQKNGLDNQKEASDLTDAVKAGMPQKVTYSESNR